MTSAEGILPLGGMLSGLGSAEDNGEWFSLETGQNGKGYPKEEEWCPSPSQCQW